MSDLRKVHLRYEAFARGFLHPLMTGGTAEVGRPIAPGCLDHFAAARPGDGTVDQELYGAIHARATEIAPVRALPYPDRGTTALAIACHNLVALTDPLLDRLFARGARPVILRWAIELIGAAGAPKTRGETLARHAVVSRALELARTDVVVKNWAYTYRFFGRTVPGRVVALPSVRRVKQESVQRPLLGLLSDVSDPGKLDVQATLRELVRRSPVTELLRLDIARPYRFGAAAAAVLSDPRVRYGVARELVKRDLDSYDEPLGEALHALAKANPPPSILYYVLAFVLELLILDTLDAEGTPRALRHETPEAALFGAILPAVLGQPTALAPLVDLAPPDLQKIRERAQALDQAIDPAVVKVAMQLVTLARHPGEGSATVGAEP